MKKIVYVTFILSLTAAFASAADSSRKANSDAKTPAVAVTAIAGDDPMPLVARDQTRHTVRSRMPKATPTAGEISG